MDQEQLAEMDYWTDVLNKLTIKNYSNESTLDDFHNSQLNLYIENVKNWEKYLKTTTDEDRIRFGKSEIETNIQNNNSFIYKIYSSINNLEILLSKLNDKKFTDIKDVKMKVKLTKSIQHKIGIYNKMIETYKTSVENWSKKDPLEVYRSMWFSPEQNLQLYTKIIDNDQKLSAVAFDIWQKVIKE